MEKKPVRKMEVVNLDDLLSSEKLLKNVWLCLQDTAEMTREVGFFFKRLKERRDHLAIYETSKILKELDKHIKDNESFLECLNRLIKKK